MIFSHGLIAVSGLSINNQFLLPYSPRIRIYGLRHEPCGSGLEALPTWADSEAVTFSAPITA